MADEQATKHKGGAPTLFNEKLASRICAEIGNGKSMRTVCAMDGMPGAETVYGWLRKREKFSEQYAKACRERAEVMAEDIMDISDDGSNDWMERNYGDKVEWITNGEALQRSRLRVDTRKWLMSKLAAKKYGDKLDMTTNGKDLPTPIFGGQSAVPTNNSNPQDIPAPQTD